MMFTIRVMKIQTEEAAMKPATPQTELPLAARLRKAVFGGCLMIDSGNGQPQRAKELPPILRVTSRHSTN